MIKRFMLLLFTAALVSSILLLAGTAILDRVNAVNASSSLPALTVSTTNLFDEKPEENLELPAENLAVPPSEESTIRAGEEVNLEAAAPQLTIADLLSSTDTSHGTLVTINGMVNFIDEDEFLLNDGTGQIIVDLNDETLGQLPFSSGDLVTVSGKFENDRSYLDINACQITTTDGTVVVLNCSDIDDEYADINNNADAEKLDDERDASTSTYVDDDNGANDNSIDDHDQDDDQSSSGSTSNENQNDNSSDNDNDSDHDDDDKNENDNDHDDNDDHDDDDDDDDDDKKGDD